MTRSGMQILSNEQSGNIFESLIEGVQIINFDWKYIYVNEALVKVSGYSRAELLGITMMEKYPGIENTKLFKSMEICMKERISQVIDNEFVFPNGSISLFNLSIQPIDAGIIILSIDITEKYMIKENLLKANRLYAFLSAVNQSIVHLKNEQELLDEACRIAVQIGEFRTARIDVKDEESGKCILTSHCAVPEIIDLVKTHDSIDLESPSLKEMPHGKVLSTDKYALSNDLMNDPGAFSWKQDLQDLGIQSVISFPLKRSGKTIAVFSLYAAITNFFDDREINLLEEAVGDISFALDNFEKEREHKQTEELVEKNERRFRALIEKSSDMKTLSSVEGKMFYASPSITKVLGYTAEEFMQKSGAELIHADDLPVFQEKRASIILTHGASFTYQHRILHKNGHWIWCESTLTNLLHEPSILAIVSNFRDISKKKLAEELREFDKNNLNALINNMSDLMWSVDIDFNLITSNVTFDKVTSASGKKIEK